MTYVCGLIWIWLFIMSQSIKRHKKILGECEDPFGKIYYPRIEIASGIQADPHGRPYLNMVEKFQD